MERLTLSPSERIKNSKQISTLIRQGQAFFLSPFKVHFRWIDASNVSPVRVAFAVPKKKFSKAVVRNRLKRLSRESYRTQKEIVFSVAQGKEQDLEILFLYQRTTQFSYSKVEEAMKDCLTEICKRSG
jgi:ribonuclease P protein component